MAQEMANKRQMRVIHAVDALLDVISLHLQNSDGASFLPVDWVALLRVIKRVSPEKAIPELHGIDFKKLHRSEKTKSGFVGIYMNGQGFRATGRASVTSSEHVYIGTYQTAEEAAWKRYLHYKEQGLPYGELETVIEKYREISRRNGTVDTEEDLYGAAMAALVKEGATIDPDDVPEKYRKYADGSYWERFDQESARQNAASKVRDAARKDAENKAHAVEKAARDEKEAVTKAEMRANAEANRAATKAKEAQVAELQREAAAKLAPKVKGHGISRIDTSRLTPEERAMVELGASRTPEERAAALAAALTPDDDGMIQPPIDPDRWVQRYVDDPPTDLVDLPDEAIPWPRLVR